MLIADDHVPTRSEIRESLDADPRFVVCAELADAVAAVRAALDQHPDVCLLDVQMPGGGVQAAWEICARLPATKVVMLSISGDDVALFGALRAGASGYLLKDMDLTCLPDGLSDVMAGKAAMPGELVARLTSRLRDPAPRRRDVEPDPVGRLTSREWDVWELIRDGRSTRQIAEQLSVSPITVRTHTQALVRKLGVRDRAALRDRAAAVGRGDI